MSDEIEQDPFPVGQKCQECGSTDYADCTLDPRTMKPVSCDRCPKILNHFIHPINNEVH